MDYKEVKINERTWRLGKFDARTGSKIIKKLTPVVASFLGGQKDLKVEESNIDFMGIITAISELKDEDFDYIRDSSLKVVHELLPAGYAPVINENGSYGVMNIEYDTSLVLGLTAHALMFNVSGFLAGTRLGSIIEQKLDTFQHS